jgi:hypothetical protein
MSFSLLHEDTDLFSSLLAFVSTRKSNIPFHSSSIDRLLRHAFHSDSQCSSAALVVPGLDDGIRRHEFRRSSTATVLGVEERASAPVVNDSLNPRIWPISPPGFGTGHSLVLRDNASSSAVSPSVVFSSLSLAAADGA